MIPAEADFLLDSEVTYLNHGSFGATPETVFKVYQDWQRQLEFNPHKFVNNELSSQLFIARKHLADFLGTTTDKLAMVMNTTEGINTIARSLDLQPGDEILGTNLMYGAMDRVWTFIAATKGCHYRKISLELPLPDNQQLIEQIWREVSPNTRVILLDHITSSTAFRMPLEEICTQAQARGIITIVDGAHAPGQIELNLDALPVDYYVGNLHKWLCNPKSAGFIYSRDGIDKVTPLTISWGWQSNKFFGFKSAHEWMGTRDYAAWLTISKTIEIFKQHNTEDNRQTYHRLLTRAQLEITNLSGLVSIYASPVQMANQMVSLLLPPSIVAKQLQKRLLDEFNVVVLADNLENIPLLRISIHRYNTDEDIDKLINALKICF